MKKEIDWEKQARRDFNPVEIWNKAMDKLPSRLKIFTTPEDNIINLRKQTAVLLAKNPNHFRELALKSAQKRRERMGEVA